MRYWHRDIGTINAGNTVEVVIDTAANIRIMDDLNFNKFKSGEPQEYIGGYARFSPYRLTLPRSARWHVVVDLGGQEGSVSASVRVYQGQGKNIPKAQVVKFK